MIEKCILKLAWLRNIKAFENRHTLNSCQRTTKNKTLLSSWVIGIFGSNQINTNPASRV